MNRYFENDRYRFLLKLENNNVSLHIKDKETKLIYFEDSIQFNKVDNVFNFLKEELYNYVDERNKKLHIGVYDLHPINKNKILLTIMLNSNTIFDIFLSQCS